MKELQIKLIQVHGIQLFSSYINGLILTRRNSGNQAVADKITALNFLFNLSMREMDLVYNAVINLDSAIESIEFSS